MDTTPGEGATSEAEPPSRSSGVYPSWGGELLAIQRAGARVGDVAFLGSMALAPKRDSLAEAEGRPSRLVFASELATSLETRRRYVLLRATITREQLTTGRARLIFRRIGTAIAILVGQDIYPLLRVADRRQLRTLQARILDWLRSKGRDSDAVVQVARRLHQDLLMFADLIAKVDCREELVEYDAARAASPGPTRPPS